MDDERLKNFGTVLTKDYFEEQLQRVLEIRLSERRFYQKITDIYVTSIDYDARSNITRQFFARVQNQLHWTIHGETAAGRSIWECRRGRTSQTVKFKGLM